MGKDQGPILLERRARTVSFLLRKVDPRDTDQVTYSHTLEAGDDFPMLINYEAYRFSTLEGANRWLERTQLRYCLYAEPAEVPALAPGTTILFDRAVVEPPTLDIPSRVLPFVGLPGSVIRRGTLEGNWYEVQVWSYPGLSFTAKAFRDFIPKVS